MCISNLSSARFDPPDVNSIAYSSITKVTILAEKQSLLLRLHNIPGDIRHTWADKEYNGLP